MLSTRTTKLVPPFRQGRRLKLEPDVSVDRPVVEPAVHGRASLRNWLEAVPTILKMTQVVEQVEGSSDCAVIRGRAAITFDMDGTPVGNTFKMMCSCRKETGTWLIDNVCWNSDQPFVPVGADHR